jgi:transposase-like protein
MNENPASSEVAPQPAAPEQLPPTAEEKAQRVKQFLESRLSIRQFSAQHNIPRMSLWRWVKGARDRTTAAWTSPTTDFAELTLPAGLGRSDWAVELTLPNGTVLRMSKDVPPGIVDQLLRVC